VRGSKPAKSAAILTPEKNRNWHTLRQISKARIIKNNQIVHQDPLFTGIKVRDVFVYDQKRIYILTNGGKAGVWKILVKDNFD
jgi:glucose/arabinose dehydrogenase